MEKSTSLSSASQSESGQVGFNKNGHHQLGFSSQVAREMQEVIISRDPQEMLAVLKHFCLEAPDGQGRWVDELPGFLGKLGKDMVMMG